MENEVNAKWCEMHYKRLQHAHLALQDPQVVPPENLKPFVTFLVDSPKYLIYKSQLQQIFGRAELFCLQNSDDTVIADSPQSSRSKKRANTNVANSRITSSSIKQFLFETMPTHEFFRAGRQAGHTGTGTTSSFGCWISCRLGCSCIGCDGIALKLRARFKRGKAYGGYLGTQRRGRA